MVGGGGGIAMISQRILRKIWIKKTGREINFLIGDLVSNSKYDETLKTNKNRFYQLELSLIHRYERKYCNHTSGLYDYLISRKNFTLCVTLVYLHNSNAVDLKIRSHNEIMSGKGYLCLTASSEDITPTRSVSHLL